MVRRAPAEPRAVPVAVGDHLHLALEGAGSCEREARLLCPVSLLPGKMDGAAAHASGSPQSIINNLLLSKPIRKNEGHCQEAFLSFEKLSKWKVRLI